MNKYYYSLGLCGYEVWITDEDVAEDKIHWLFVGTEKNQIAHRTKVGYNTKGEGYFRTPHGRIHFKDCLKTNI